MNLDLTQLSDQANPVLQTKAMPTLKPTYGFASTQEIMDSLAGSGWRPVSQNALKARSKSREGYQRHMVRLQNDSFLEIPGLTQDNKSRPEIVLLNSHDGTTALRMMLGLFRIACLNGVIAGTGLREFRAVHSGNLQQKLSEGIGYMTGGIPQLIDQVTHLQGTRFTPAALEQLVAEVVAKRLQHANVVPGSIDFASVVKPRRDQDKAEDAFTVFNRIQESLIRGGIRYRAYHAVKDEDGNVTSEEIRNATTRKLSSIPQAVRLNTMVYDLAVKLAA